MKDAPGYQLVGVQWKCNCGHEQRSVVTAEPYIKTGRQPTPAKEYEVECKECNQFALVSLFADVVEFI